MDSRETSEGILFIESTTGGTTNTNGTNRGTTIGDWDTTTKEESTGNVTDGYTISTSSGCQVGGWATEGDGSEGLSLGRLFRLGSSIIISDQQTDTAGTVNNSNRDRVSTLARSLENGLGGIDGTLG